MPRRTLLVVIVDRLRVRNMLQTELFERLRARGDNLVIVSPFSSEPSFRERFGGASVSFAPIGPLDRLALFIISLREEALLFPDGFFQESRRIKRQMARRFLLPALRRISKACLRRAILAVLPGVRTSKRFWNRLMRLTPSVARTEALLKRYSPDGILTATAGKAGAEKPFLIAAEAMGIPVMAVDENIDAPEYRYFSPPWGDAHFACFGEPQQEEFGRLQRIPSERLRLCGALRYDRYFTHPAYETRDTFVRGLGLDPARPYLLFATTDPLKYPYNENIVELLTDAAKETDSPLAGIQLYVRFDEHDDLTGYPTEFLNSLRFERAGERGDIGHVMNLLHHASAAIGVGVTTLAIEAVSAGTPAAWAAFDGFAHPPSHESVTAQYELPFARRIAESGGVAVARTPEELIRVLEESVRSPERSAPIRTAMLRTEYANAEGHSASGRIMTLFDELTSKAPGRKAHN